MEETGAVEAIVGVLYDLFPDDEDMTESEEIQVSDSNESTQRSRSLETEQPIETNRPLDTDRSMSPSTSSTPIHSARPSTPAGQDEIPASQASDQQIDHAPDQRQDREDRIAAILFPIVDLIYEVSSNQRCAEVLVLSGALHYIVLIMDSIRNSQDELLPLCIAILWNVLELCHEKMKSVTKCASRRELLVQFRLRNAAYFLGNEFTFQTLLHTLELLLVHGYRKQDKEMRNECLMVLHLLARRRRSLDHFYSTGLTTCLLSYATAAESQKKKTNDSKSKSLMARPSSARAVAINANHHNYATNCEEDFEFKQMLWYLLAEIMCDHEANLNELVQFRFTEILLRYATGAVYEEGNSLSGGKPASSSSSSSTQQHSLVQLHLLQTTALSVLNHIAPFILSHVYEVDGHVILLEFLKRSVMQSDENLTAAWLLLVQISPPIAYYQDELGKIEAVDAAIAAFATPPSRYTFGIRRNAIVACASMCRNHELNRKRFYHANGVHFVTQHLEFDPSHSVLEDNILIGVVDAVRSCVVGDIDNETAFIDDDGVPKLLTILEKVPKAVKNQVLAALAEICVNPSAIPSFLAWRSDQKETNNATANQTLLRIYADEEAVEELRTKAENENQTVRQNPEILALTNARHSSFKSVANCRSPFLVSANYDSEKDPIACSASPTSPTERPESPAFARLKEALKAAQGISTDINGQRRSLLELKDSESHPEINLKAKIYAVLANVSFACDMEKLTAHDQVMLEVAKEYPTFQLGEMWQNVHLALHAEGIRPIYADALYIRRHIEHAYNISVCTKHAQKEIFSRTNQVHSADEQAFFQQVLLQKHQEAQAEAFHRANLRQNSTLKLHFDAKKTRLEFMRKQDPASFAAYESDERCRIDDPAPESDYSDLNSLEQKEAELRGRVGTITRRK